MNPRRTKQPGHELDLVFVVTGLCVEIKDDERNSKQRPNNGMNQRTRCISGKHQRFGRTRRGQVLQRRLHLLEVGRAL